jgi:hypothetical protein
MSYLKLEGVDHPTTLEVVLKGQDKDGEFMFVIRDSGGRTLSTTFLSLFDADRLGRFLLDEAEEV